MTHDAVFLSVPYTEPVPAVAPVLLSACLESAGMRSRGIDFSVAFYDHFHKKEYWPVLKRKLTANWLENDPIPRRAIIDVLKFNKKFLLDVKEKYDPRWIGLSIFSLESLDFSNVLIYSIRKYLPETLIAIGGKGAEATIAGTDISNCEDMIMSGAVDLAIMGDCEHMVADLFKNDITGFVTADQQTTEEFDSIPMAKWDDYDMDKYREKSMNITDDLTKLNDHGVPPSSRYNNQPFMTITASKGCIRKCTFCDVQHFWPKYMYRNPERVAQDIISAHQKTGISYFQFSDNLINGSVTNYRKMNEILARELPKGSIGYGGYAIFRNKDQMPDEDFELAARAGCSNWAVGIESGSEKVRFDMLKKVTDEGTYHSTEMCAKHGIVQDWLMFVGYPTETEEDFQMSMDLLRKYAHLGRKNMIRTTALSFMMIPTSPIGTNLKLRDELGLTESADTNLMDQRFWISNQYPENTFDVRYDRWWRLMSLIEDLGYSWNEMQDKNTLKAEMKGLLDVYLANKEKIVATNRRKIIPIHQD